MDGGVLLGIAFVVALSLTASVVLRVLLSSPSVFGWVGDVVVPALRRRLRRRRLHAVEAPANRPIETIAAQVRRLGAEYHGGPPGRSWVKCEALRRAYDDALAEACRALEVGTDLVELEPGSARDFERVRIERVLAAAGLVMRHRPAA